MISSRLVLFPFVVSWLILFTLSVAIFFSALIVLYRDFRHTLQFIQQLGFYFSPVGFLSQLVPYPWKYLFFLNPLAGIIEITRWIFLQLPCNNLCVFISLGSTFLLGWASLSYFFYVENYFADII
jgi:lipopolysaccharide transport system permease protein